MTTSAELRHALDSLVREVAPLMRKKNIKDKFAFECARALLARKPAPPETMEAFNLLTKLALRYEDALREIAGNESACTCVTEFSWYGDGHTSGCPIEIANTALDEPLSSQQAQACGFCGATGTNERGECRSCGKPQPGDEVRA